MSDSSVTVIDSRYSKANPFIVGGIVIHRTSSTGPIVGVTFGLTDQTVTPPTFGDFSVLIDFTASEFDFGAIVGEAVGGAQSVVVNIGVENAARWRAHHPAPYGSDDGDDAWINAHPHSTALTRHVFEAWVAYTFLERNAEGKHVFKNGVSIRLVVGTMVPVTVHGAPTFTPAFAEEVYDPSFPSTPDERRAYVLGSVLTPVGAGRATGTVAQIWVPNQYDPEDVDRRTHKRSSGVPSPLTGATWHEWAFGKLNRDENAVMLQGGFELFAGGEVLKFFDARFP